MGRKRYPQTQHEKLDDIAGRVIKVEARQEMILKFLWMIMGVTIISALESFNIFSNHIPHYVAEGGWTMCSWLLSLTLEKLAISSFIGAIVSFISERWDWFQELDEEAKKAVVFVLSVCVPILALFVGVNLSCAGMVITIDTLAMAISVGIASWMSSQTFHNYVNKK